MQTLKIKNIKKVKYNGRVMNLHVDKNNNYFANKILAHNCYQSSTKEGAHAETYFLAHSLPKILMDAGVMEVNFGGGEPTLYKSSYGNLKYVLDAFKHKKFKVGVTTKNYKWHNDKEFSDCMKSIDSVAISVNSLEELKRAEELEKAIGEVAGSNASVYFQCVFELTPYEDFKKFVKKIAEKWNRNITLLGYKDFGFGKGGAKHSYPDEWISDIKSLHESKRLNVGIDSVMVANWREKLIEFGVKDYYLVGTEGKSTCYVDAVKKKMYSSSFSDEEGLPMPSSEYDKKVDFLKNFATF